MAEENGVNQQQLDQVLQQQMIREVIEEAGFEKCFLCGSEKIVLNFTPKLEHDQMLVEHMCFECKGGFKKTISGSDLENYQPEKPIIFAPDQTTDKLLPLAILAIFKKSIKKALDSRKSDEVEKIEETH